MSTNAFTYLLVALIIVLLVAIAAGVYAAARMWQHRERARDDLDPRFRRPTK